ncbi:uncharacterized protein BP5553_01263 [Venustampulla echinocandica]|uniref:Uncharacterized protein n=1 Tax=Venustampulla echinocandica TaxID=2656787 RepID=A0A370U0J1_9HELO|nr:uncharacterized protein BP5553_01263 [Venustampulla echinocandica]RDL41284.1 hypothetical protein BP5553_01263 [Venustampulla echinocandica]
MSSRRTRAHPSPSGFRQLEDQPRKRTTRARTQKTIKTIADSAQAAVDAPAASASASASARPLSPPTGTSRSQSENEHDVESDPQAVPESRSTSPPSPIHAQPSTSRTRTISPPSFKPFTLNNLNKVAKRTSPIGAARSRNQLNNKNASTTSPGRKPTSTKAPVHSVLGKHSRVEASSSTHQSVDDFDIEELSRPAKRTRNDMNIEPDYHYRSDSSVDMDALEDVTGNPISDREHQKKMKEIRAMEHRRELLREKKRMAKEEKASYLIIPENSTEKRLELKRNDIIDATRCLAKWAERDPSNPVPNAQQLEALLEAFKTQELAKAAATQATGEVPTTAGVVHEDTSTHHRDGAEQPDQPSAPMDAEADISETETEIEEPEFPGPPKTPEPKESRLWSTVSRVKDIVTTPFNFTFMGRRGESTIDATPIANHPSESPTKLAYDQLPAIPESLTRTPARIRRRRAPVTDKPAEKMQFTSGVRVRDITSQRAPAATPTHRNPWAPRAQTERKKRPYRAYLDKKPPTVTPVHLAGVITQERIKEIQDRQDREAEDRLAKARQESRRARVEDEEVSLAREHIINNETLSQAGQETGKKRKRRSVRTPPENAPGVFTVPYESSSEEGDSESENDTLMDTAGIVPTPLPVPQLPQIPISPTPVPRHVRRKKAPAKEKPVEPKRSLNLFKWDENSPTTAEITRMLCPPESPPTTLPSEDVLPVSPDYTLPSEESIPVSNDITIPSEQSLPVSNDSTLPSEEPLSMSNDITIPSEEALNIAVPEELQQLSYDTAQQTTEWQQTPPAKPRPSNAQLPPAPQPSALALANAKKYQPKHPSKLRNMTKMSPLHGETSGKENAGVGEGEGARPFTFDNFTAGVEKAVERLPEDFWVFPE